MREAKDPATRPDIVVLATLSVIESWLEFGESHALSKCGSQEHLGNSYSAMECSSIGCNNITNLLGYNLQLYNTE